MEERKFIRLKKEEFGIKEYIKRDLGKGKISKLDIEYTPVGEKIIISTNKPGLVIGKRGEKIQELTEVLKKRFKLENPHIEIQEIQNPLFDAQSVADEIAMALERMGNLKFKVIAYKKLREIMRAGALGCEMRLTGKLPSERANSWRFAEGYLKKAGESRKEIDRAQATALTKTGIIGIKVAIMNPNARIYDRIDINEEMKRKIKGNLAEEETKPKKEKKERIKSSEKIEEDIVKEEKKKIKDHKETKDKAERKIAKKIAEEVEEERKVEEDIEKFEESHEIPVEEDGTSIKIEQEIEEGVPEGLDKELKELEGKIDKGKEINRREIKNE